jgi:CelD/BcsL family acetyltransferase involved in cellulose biosynthesis
MRFQVAENVEPAQWNKALCSLGGTIYHSTMWADYMKTAQPHAESWFMRMESDDDTLLGMALGFHTRSSHMLLAPFTGRLSLDALPAVSENDPAALADFIRQMERSAREKGNSELAVGSFASPRSDEAFQEPDYELTRYFEFELGLERSEEELWEGLDYKRQKNIRKAERASVSIHDLPVGEGIRELRRLQGESSKRIVERGGPDITHYQDSSSDPVETLVNAGVGRLIGTCVNGAIVSASLFTCFNGLVYHTLSGHSREALQSQAPTFLLWETIKRYRMEGAKRFNFGGCSVDAVNEDSAEHGVYVYKEAFGGEIIKCTSGLKVLRKMRHQLAGLARRLLGR